MTATPPPRKTMREILHEISPTHLRDALRAAQIQIDGQLREVIQQIARQDAAAWSLFPNRLSQAGRDLIEQGERLKTMPGIDLSAINSARGESE
jgi:hypothetical protein